MTENNNATGQQPNHPHADPLDNSAPLTAQLVDECRAMAKYALSNGLEIEVDAIGELQQQLEHVEQGSFDAERVEELATVHQKLAKSVYPATPRAITLLENERKHKSPLYFLGPVPLIRQLSGAAGLALLALLIVSLSGQVNSENINLGLLNSDNKVLFLNQLFLVFAAGLGACFSALFLANSYIAKATYDPRFDSSYWSRIILGVIAGIILVELLPSSMFDEGSMKNFGKPSLAMFGRFSANVVYRILQRIVESLETLVRGRADNNLEHQQSMLQAKASEQRSQINAETANKLVDLSKNIDKMSSEDISQEINTYVKKLLSEGGRRN